MAYSKDVVFCFILPLMIFNCVALTPGNEIKMIADVINFYNKPSGVLVRACWPALIKKSFTTELNNLTSSKQVQFIRNVHDIPENLPKHNAIVVVDTKCDGSSEFLTNANLTNKFRHPYRWVIIANHAILKDLQDFHILIDAEVLVCERNRDNFTLYFPYKRQQNCSEWKIESFGTWTLEQRLNNIQEMFSTSSMRRKNLERMAMVASIVITNNKTREFLFSLKDPHIDLITKAGVRQLMPLYQFMNSTPTLRFTNTWGYLKNGTVNGMIGDLLRGNSEIGGTVIFMTRERLSMLEYLSVPTKPTVKFVFRQPSLSYQNNLFILPFKPIVWCCIFVLVILIFIITFISTLWESIKMEKKDAELDRIVLRPVSGEIAMMIIGAITQQGSFTELRGNIGRVVMFIIFLVFLFLYTAYSANIVALLQSSSDQIKTLSDMLNSKLELGVEDTPYNRHFFSTATDPVKKAIYEKKIAPRGSKPNFMTLYEGVLKMQKKPFAFNMFLGSGYLMVEKYFLDKEKCGLQELAYLDQTLLWQTCRKNSPFKEIFKIGLLRNSEHGINSRETLILFGKKPECTSRGGVFDSVYMTDFYPALLMLAYGMGLSVLLLILEIVFWRRVNYNNIA